MHLTRHVMTLAILAASASAQLTLPPGVSHVQTFDGAALNLPGSLGGLEFSADGSILYCGTNANTANGEVRALPVMRDPATNEILGLGAATPLAPAPFIDGGLQLGPGGTLFWTTFSNHRLGQLAPSGTQIDFSLAPTGVPSSTGSLEFVPAGLPNAGDLLVASYSGGSIYRITITDNGDGTYTPDAGSATLFAPLPTGTEGMRHVPAGPGAGSMAIVSFSLGNISLLEIDQATGLPRTDAMGNLIIAPFITGVAGAEGLAFDPLTNDFFVSSYSNRRIFQFNGFPAPPSLGPCAAGNTESTQGAPIECLTVNGSAGGPARRVDVIVSTPISITMSQPPGNAVPANFAIYGFIGVPAPSDVVTLPIGDLCFVPNDLAPHHAGTFVLTSSFDPSHPTQLLPSTSAPWSTVSGEGLPFPFMVAFQGVIEDPTSASGLSVTNGVLLRTL